MSSSPNSRVPIPGGNGFTYEYSFQLKAEAKSIAHIYPFIDAQVDYLVQNNFDFDDDGYIKVYSAAKSGIHQQVSGDDSWKKNRIKVLENERNKSLDIRIVKDGNKSNDMVFYIVNQYNEPIPFFASPIGGIPQYQYKLNVNLELKKRTK